MSTQPMQPEQATFLLHAVALPWLKVEHPLTRKVIEAVPLDKGDYRPNPNSRPAFELAWHIASAENRFREKCGPARKDVSRPACEDHRLSRHPATSSGCLSDVRHGPHDSPSRATFDVPPSDGHEGSLDLRHELRRRSDAKEIKVAINYSSRSARMGSTFAARRAGR